jgi:hypothetical protein
MTNHSMDEICRSLTHTSHQVCLAFKVPFYLIRDLLNGYGPHPTPPANCCQGKMRNDIFATFIAFWGITHSSLIPAEAGRVFERHNPAYTSQTCCVCGHRQKMPLKLRVFVYRLIVIGMRLITSIPHKRVEKSKARGDATACQRGGNATAETSATPAGQSESPDSSALWGWVHLVVL